MAIAQLACLILALAVAPPSTAPGGVLDIRVGLTAYGDFRPDLARYDRLFADMAAASPRPIRFHLAAGNYGDISHWLDQGWIDIAIVAPGVFAQGSAPPNANGGGAAVQYLATVTLPPATSTLGDEDRRTGRRDAYRSVCIVPVGSAIHTLGDLREAVAQKRVRFLWVDPVSVSGHLAPEVALAAEGIVPDSASLTFTDSHSNSLRAVAAGDGAGSAGVVPGVTPVGFVWDGAADAQPALAAKVRRVPFARLDAMWIPADAVVARAGFAHSDLVASLLVDKRPEEFRITGDWATRYAAVWQWARAAGMPTGPAAAQRVSLDELGDALLHYAHSQPRPPRLGVVLAGGGAKCAFQVGAVGALEEELTALRRDHDDAGLDIALVVGTSGGAINALPVAMGVTATEQGRLDFADVWRHLDQRDIIVPPLGVRVNMWLWFAAIEAFAILTWMGRRHRAHAERRRRRVVWVLLVVGAAGLALVHMPWTPWWLMGRKSLLHHAWLWAAMGLAGSPWLSLAGGVVALLWLRFGSGAKTASSLPSRRTRGALLAAIFILPPLQAATILFWTPTLTTGGGIERTLQTQFSRLTNLQLNHAGAPPLEAAQSDVPGRLREMSRQIISRGLIRRDLVLTGSCLERTDPAIPTDLYFYVRAGDATQSPLFAQRGFDIRQRPELLLQVLMGSGSIYPVFPARTLEDFPRPHESVDLVDGSFAHRSPVEAAVLWGATHIVLIEAAPDERTPRGSFLENIGAAANHLYDQAQLSDIRSKQHVTIFTLTPKAPHIGLLDFADNLIDAAIAKGYREARGGATVNEEPRASFIKEPGEPLFWEAGTARGAADSRPAPPPPLSD